MSKPQLISFELCPFVQRSVITLKEKGIDFDITYIDIDNKPEWFLKLSPFAKVPVLKVETEVLFESAVINEYLDEVYAPSMHPSDPLKKAHNRAWIELASALIMTMFNWAMTQDQTQYDTQFKSLVSYLNRVEDQVQGSYFNGDSFCLIDAAFAPFFRGLTTISDYTGQEYLKSFLNLNAYSEALLKRQSVQESVVPDGKEKLIKHIRKKQSILAGLFKD